MADLLPPGISLTLDAIQEMLEQRQAVVYTITASVALLTYEYIITVFREMNVVWQGSWGTGKALFLLNRYCPPAALLLELIGFLLWYPPESFCRVWYPLITCLFILCIMFNQGILAARTWAIWGGNRRMLIFLCSSLAADFAVSCVVIGWNLRSTTIIANNFILPQGCLVVLPNTLLWTSYFPSTVFETLIFTLTAAKAIKEGHVRTGLTPLLAQLIQHGLGYFAVALALSLFNVLIFAIAPQALIALGLCIQITLQSILCSRLLLSIRETSRGQTTVTSSDAEAITLPIIVHRVVFSDHI